MADMNKVWLSGQVITEPVMTQVGFETPSTIFTLQVDENFVDRAGNKRTKSNFIDVESLGRQSTRAKNTIKKGSRVFVEGYLRQDEENKVNIVKVRTFAVYKDETDNNLYHLRGVRAALDILKRSRDIPSAIEGIEAIMR